MRFRTWECDCDCDGDGGLYAGLLKHVDEEAAATEAFERKKAMSNKHVMLDIETMSSNSNAALAQIGACVFSVHDGSISSEFKCNVSVGDCRELGMHVDPNTEKWWSQQDPAAIASIMAEPRETPRVALASFRAWYPPGAVVWSHATFDAVIMQNAYARLDWKCPWHFRDARDLRTITGLFAFGGRKVPAELWEREGVHHDALHNARYQVKIASYQIRGILGIPHP